MAFGESGRGLFGDSFEPVDHSEHDAHGDEADAEEYCPCHPDGTCVIDQRADPKEQVAASGGSEPETLAKTLHVLGLYL